MIGDFRWNDDFLGVQEYGYMCVSTMDAEYSAASGVVTDLGTFERVRSEDQNVDGRRTQLKNAKHVDVKIKLVTNCLNIMEIRTKEMPADLMTKAKD
ncbi:hypothetical protein PsorP6_005419 [Peronosclerospora sorghi]|uniref:Uncharacterized protein n=1 Tax=Peronosclerospora sorghi TaxID=230839 RepID=A0ACC0W3H2_9STRA|nr:hypothetical protein PsorP6_005419 [Peronosclerospora sorghi]